MDIGENGGVGELILSNDSRASINVNGYLRIGENLTGSTGMVRSVGGSGFDSVYVTGTTHIARGAGTYGELNLGNMNGGDLVLGMGNDNRSVGNGLLVATNAVVDFNRNFAQNVLIGSSWNGNSGTVSFVDSVVQMTNISLHIGQGGANRTGLLQVTGGSLRTDGTHFYVGRDAGSSIGEIHLLDVTNAVLRANNDFHLGTFGGRGAIRATNSVLTLTNTAGEFWFGVITAGASGIVQVTGGVFTQNMAGTGRTIYGWDNNYGELTLRNTTNSYIRAGGELHIAGSTDGRGLVDLGNFVGGTFIVTNNQTAIANAGNTFARLVGTNGTFVFGNSQNIRVSENVGAATGHVQLVDATVNFQNVGNLWVSHNNASAVGTFDVIGGTNQGSISSLLIGANAQYGRVTLGGQGIVTNSSSFRMADAGTSDALLVVSNGSLLLTHNTITMANGAGRNAEIEIGSGGLVHFSATPNYTLGASNTLEFRDGGRYAMQSGTSTLTVNGGATIRGDGVITGNVSVASGGTVNVGWATGGDTLRVTGNFTNQSGSVLRSGSSAAGIGSNAVLHVDDMHVGQSFTIFASTNFGGSFGSLDSFSGVILDGSLSFAAGQTVTWSFDSFDAGWSVSNPFFGGMRADTDIFTSLIGNGDIALAGLPGTYSLFSFQTNSHWYLAVGADTTIVWDGQSGVNGNWSTGDNWVGDVAPANDGSAKISFASESAGTRTNAVVDTAWNIDSLTFQNSTLSNYVINGQPITLNATEGLKQLSTTTTQRIDSVITTAVDQVWDIRRGLIIGGGIEGDHDLAVIGNANGRFGLTNGAVVNIGRLTMTNGVNFFEVNTGEMNLSGGFAISNLAGANLVMNSPSGQSFDFVADGISTNRLNVNQMIVANANGSSASFIMTNGAVLGAGSAITNLLIGTNSGSYGHVRLAGTNGTTHLFTNVVSGLRIGGSGGTGILEIAGMNFQTNTVNFFGNNTNGYSRLVIDGGNLNIQQAGEIYWGNDNSSNRWDLTIQNGSTGWVQSSSTMRIAEDTSRAEFRVMNNSILTITNTSSDTRIAWGNAADAGTNNQQTARFVADDNSTLQIHSAGGLYMGQDRAGTTAFVEILNGSTGDIRSASTVYLGDDNGHFRGLVSNSSTLTMTNTGGNLHFAINEGGSGSNQTAVLTVTDNSNLRIRSAGDFYHAWGTNSYAQITLEDGSRGAMNVGGILWMGRFSGATGIIQSVGSGSGFDGFVVSNYIHLATDAHTYGLLNLGDMQGGSLDSYNNDSSFIIGNGAIIATNGTLNLNIRTNLNDRSVFIGSWWNGNNGEIRAINSSVVATNLAGLYIGAQGGNRTGLLEVTGGSLIVGTTNDIRVGRDAGSVGSILLNNVTNATLAAMSAGAGSINIGDNGGTGRLMATNSTLTVTSMNIFSIGWLGSSTGSVHVQGGSFSLFASNITYIGQDAAAYGELILRNTTNSRIHQANGAFVAGGNAGHGLVDLGNFVGGEFIATNGLFRVGGEASGTRGTFIATNGTFTFGNTNSIHSGVGANTGEVRLVNATVNLEVVDELQVGYNNAAAKGVFDIIGGTNNGQIGTIRIGQNGGDGRVTFGGVGTITNTSELNLANGANSEGLLVVSNATLLVNHNNVNWSAANSTGTMQIGQGGEVRFQGSTINQNYTIQTNATLNMAGGVFRMTNVASHLVVTNGATLQGFGTMDVAQLTARSGSVIDVNGTMNVAGNVTFNAGANVFDMQVGSDRLDIAGNFTNATTFSILDNGSLSGNYAIDISGTLTLTDTITWDFSSIGMGSYYGGMRAVTDVFSTFLNDKIVLGGAASGRTLGVYETGGFYYLYIEVIPEPSTYALMIFGGIALVFALRYRHKRGAVDLKQNKVP